MDVLWLERSLDNKIIVLHEGALLIAYNDYPLSFETLLENYFSVTIHQKNLQCPATEIYKIKNKLAPPFICDLINNQTLHIIQDHTLYSQKVKMAR